MRGTQRGQAKPGWEGGRGLLPASVVGAGRLERAGPGCTLRVRQAPEGSRPSWVRPARPGTEDLTAKGCRMGKRAGLASRSRAWVGERRIGGWSPGTRREDAERGDGRTRWERAQKEPGEFGSGWHIFEALESFLTSPPPLSLHPPSPCPVDTAGSVARNPCTLHLCRFPHFWPLLPGIRTVPLPQLIHPHALDRSPVGLAPWPEGSFPNADQIRYLKLASPRSSPKPWRSGPSDLPASSQSMNPSYSVLSSHHRRALALLRAFTLRIPSPWTSLAV